MMLRYQTSVPAAATVLNRRARSRYSIKQTCPQPLQYQTDVPVAARYDKRGRAAIQYQNGHARV
eukprot:4950624-Pyramimonas_sp.AAC.1